MHDITPQQLQVARIIFGKAKLIIPDFSGISANQKFYAHMKQGGEIVLVDVQSRGKVYELECWTETGRPRKVPIVEIWGFDCGDQIINANELRVVEF